MGNILTQKRNGGGASPTALDELTYNYHTTTDGLVSNRLYQVNDVVSAGNYSDDIDDQGTFNNTHSTIETANNYGYDELGNLVRDVQEEIASIEWTVYGKMKKITRNSGSSKADLEFGYDASGNRLWKKVTPKGSGAVISTYYYLRDAQGNEMCRYVKYTNTSSQLMYVAQEHSIYGSSRVGVDGRKDTLYKAGNYSPSWGGVGTSRRALGLKSFELANHLGNVLVTVSDKPIYKVSSGTIYFQSEITSLSDYYPFGAPINGRSFLSTEYRFGFNTQEKIDEISGPGNHNTAYYGEYVGRLGRRWNQDPKPNQSISNYATFANNPIWFNDHFLDTIKSTEEGFNIVNDGLNSTLGKEHGFTYNKEKGVLSYTKNKENIYSKEQQDLVNRYKDLIALPSTIEVNIVGISDYIPEMNTSLGKLDFNGATKSDLNNPTLTLVFIAKDPVGYSQTAGWYSAPSYTSSLVSIHEIAGHAYLRLCEPNISNHNDQVEIFETTVRKFYQIGIYENKRSVRRDKRLNGLVGEIGGPRFLGGVASEHSPN
jgi:hypothetical protein